MTDRPIQAGDTLPGGSVLKERSARLGAWQIWRTDNGSALLASPELTRQWEEEGQTEPGIFLPLNESWFFLEEAHYGLISSAEAGPYPRTSQETAALAETFLRTRKACPDGHLGSALYVPRLPYLLLCGTGADRQEDPWTLGRWVAGGMNAPFTDWERMRTWAPGLTEDLYRTLLAGFGWQETAPEKLREPLRPSEAAVLPASVPRGSRQEGEFSLPGRRELQTFFRERILDVIDREEEYRRMGILFPGPTLLYGPPGCGKTFAVERLAEYLGWPVFSVNAASIASSYIHETSRLIARLFEQAMDSAPSVVVMDEMEAYLSSRGGYGFSGTAHSEEMAEFLRLLPQLPEKRVLLFGMTNMPEEIDPAIKRKGRFDHILELSFPTRAELTELLSSLLKDIPKEKDLHLGDIAARLEGRAISDAAFVAKEAGRLAVVRHRQRIGQDLLEEACAALSGQKEYSKHRIGFS